MNNTKRIRALGLCSGGLDSILSALVLRNQGIEVEWITFQTPFFSADKARAASCQTGIPLRIEDITDDYLTMLKAPPAGFGKNMNPCMDCHALMFRRAGNFMGAGDFDFLFSGEVLGQRPMSQNANSLRYVEKHSGYRDLILRPLSAKRLAPTEMENRGLVDREQLLDFSGRSRKPQMQLAEQFGIRDYPSPAGGCLLTDPGYSKRLRDIMGHLSADEKPRRNVLHLLKYGRYLRLTPTEKLIVGRTQNENENLLKYADLQHDTIIKVKTYPGPTAIVPGGGTKEIIYLAAAICAGYSKAPNDSPVAIGVSAGGVVEEITVLPITPQDARRFLIT